MEGSTDGSSQTHSSVGGLSEDFFATSHNSRNEEESYSQYEEKRDSDPQIYPLILFRKFRAFCLPLSCDVSDNPIDNAINPTGQNNDLKYANGNWSSFQYVSEERLLSFGGCVECPQTGKPVPHNNVVEIDLKQYSANIICNLKHAKFSPCVILVEEDVYIFGGGFSQEDATDYSDTYRDAEKLSITFPVKDSLPDMPFPKRTMNPGYYQGQIYLVGGYGSKKAFAYNIAENEYALLPDADSVSHCQAISFTISDQLLVFGNRALRVFHISNSKVLLFEVHSKPEVSLIRSNIYPKLIGEKYYFTSTYEPDFGPDKKICNRFTTLEISTRELTFGKDFKMCEEVVRDRRPMAI